MAEASAATALPAEPEEREQPERILSLRERLEVRRPAAGARRCAADRPQAASADCAPQPQAERARIDRAHAHKDSALSRDDLRAAAADALQVALTLLEQHDQLVDRASAANGSKSAANGSKVPIPPSARRPLSGGEPRPAGRSARRGARAERPRRPAGAERRRGRRNFGASPAGAPAGTIGARNGPGRRRLMAESSGPSRAALRLLAAMIRANVYSKCGRYGQRIKV